MKKLGRIFTFILLIIFILLLSNSEINNNSKKDIINKILRNQYYSYLPDEAKDYIKDVYEQTGELVLTEKNKKVNTPYLNPQYINYLTLNEQEQQEVEVIPNALKLDYSPQNIQGDSLSTYDLRSVNGNSYITPLKNQGSLGICWAFSTIEHAESYLMVNKGVPYNSSSEIFSVRQLDYAASNNGINYYENENGYRSLGDGGNFYMSSYIMANGLSLVPEDYMPMNYDLDKKELIEVLNYGNSSYEVNSTIMMPELSDDYTSTDLNEYTSMIKTYIRQYGGAYVGTGSPQGSCGSKNTDGLYIIADTSDCSSDSNYSGHAMQIIGWDDNYNYSYCLSGTKHLNVSSNGTCQTGTLVTGTGAWLIRNSWGNDPDYKYLYMSYNSNNAEIDFITSLSDMDARTWDNNYHNNPWGNNSALYSIVDMVKFSKPISSPEKLEKIKFISLSQNSKFKISVRSGSNTYSNITEVTTAMPGIITVDLSSYDITLDSSDFYVTIMSSNGTYILMNTISAFTSNKTSTPMIKTEDVVVDGVLDDSIGLVLYSATKNIPSNEEVNFSLWKGSTDYSSYLEDVFLNYVAENNMNTYVFIDSSIPSGDYKIKTEYGGYSYYSNLKINGVEITEGTGTINDPYIIYNESQLNALRYGLDKVFKLGSDITLTENWVPIGTESEPFTGIFDGDGHKITGLTINNSSTYNGLFGYVEGNTSSSYSIIKNLTIENARVTGSSDTGILVGRLNIGDYEYATFSNINIIGGEVTSTNGNAGSILGNFSSVIHANSVTMYQIFSSATVTGKETAGLIGNLDQFADLRMYLFENIGSVKVNGSVDKYHNSIVGKFHDEIMWLELYDFIITNYNYFNTSYNGHLLQQKLTNGAGKYNRSGIYIKTDNDTINHNLQTADGNVYNITDVTDLKDDSIKSNFKNDFDTYFKVETIDGIKRIPILNGANIEYTSVSNIELEPGDTVSLLDYITPITDAARIYFQTLDNEDKISVEYEYDSGVNYPKDIKITALKRGVTTLHVVSDYDGYENDIPITITGGNVNVTKPDGTTEIRPFNSTYELGVNNSSKANDNGASITFKYQDNGTPDTVDYVQRSYTPNGWLVNDSETPNNTILTLTDDVVINYNYDITYTSPNFQVPLRSHYTFLGWYDEDDNQVTSYNGVDDLILYAHWLGDEVTVTRPDNTTEIKHYGDTYELGINDVAKANESVASITFKYQDNETLDMVDYVQRSYTPNGWLVNDNEIADGTALNLTEDVTITYNYDITYISPSFPEPERNIYTFDGWFDENENHITSYNGVDNITLFAHWTLLNPSDFELNGTFLTLLVGDIYQVEAEFIPNGTNDTLIYSGYDNEIISVTDSGLITALSLGETVITVALESDNSITKTISVKVVGDELLSDSLDVETKELARIIIGEEPNTKLEDFLSKLNNDIEYISVYTENDELVEDMETIVKTGMKLKLTVGGQVQDEVVIVIRGDIDGDGLVDITDAGIMKRHIIEAESIVGFRLYAANLDVEEDETLENMINISDSGVLKRFIIEAIDTLN